jgi:DNA-binding beta-propeller fold protein YncE
MAPHKTTFETSRFFMSCLLIIGSVSVTANAELPNESRYSVVHGWPLLPIGRVMGRASGVEVDSHNHVFVFHSAKREWSEPFPQEPVEAPTVVVFDGETGKLIAEWGENLFVMPHGLSIDTADNVWLTDVGRHQVLKFSHDGELLLTLGEERVPGKDQSHFNLPTDVAVVDDGGFYVSDGYDLSGAVTDRSTGNLTCRME